MIEITHEGIWRKNNERNTKAMEFIWSRNIMITYPLSTMWNINLYVTHYIDGISKFHQHKHIKEYIFSKTILLKKVIWL